MDLQWVNAAIIMGISLIRMNIARLKQFAVELFLNYINAGVKESTHIEVARKISVLNLFAFVGFSLTFVLGVHALRLGQIEVATPLIIAFTLFFSLHLFIRFTKAPNGYVVGSILLQVVLVTLCLYLVYSGGTNNTGPLWLYLVPPVVLFFSGLRHGLMVLMAVVICYCVIVYFPDNAIGTAFYTPEFKSRLLYSFLTVIFLSGFYEFSRESTYQRLIELSNEFEQQATVDPLTHLLNRRGMLECIDYEVKRSQRSNKPMSFVIADVDFFKNINDQYGHETGDAVLTEMSDVLRSSLRRQDSISRWGGEEFLLLLPETNLAQAKSLAEKIRLRIRGLSFESPIGPFQCSMSMGVAEVYDFKNARNTINIADQRLYVAKSSGRNRVIAESEEDE